MPDLVNMSITTAETDETQTTPSAEVEIVEATPMEGEQEAGAGEEYPFGLLISLTQEDMDKLGLDAGTLHAGQEVSISARARVRSSVESEEENMASLQITDMAVDTDMGFEDAFDEAVGLGAEEEEGLT